MAGLHLIFNGILSSAAFLVVAGGVAVGCGQSTPPASRTSSPAGAESPTTISAPAKVPSTLATATAGIVQTHEPSPLPLPSVALTSTPLPTATVTPTQQSPTQIPGINRTFVDAPECADLNRTPLPARNLEISDGTRSLTLTVEVADTAESRSRGLMCRAEVPEWTGMAFQWAEPTAAGFWMYNTYVPLDLIYVDASGRVVAVRSMTPCPRDSDEAVSAWTIRCAEESQRYAPGTQYVLALELPGGWLESEGFRLSESAAWHAALK